MTPACDVRVAVVCHDHPLLRTAVIRLLEACGYDVRATTEHFVEFAQLAVAHRACVGVVALPLTGMRGLTAVKGLRTAAPHCEVVLMSPSTTLEAAAVDAGARALVPEDDLRGLRTVLQEMAVSAHGLRMPQARGHSEDAVVLPVGSVSTKPSV